MYCDGLQMPHLGIKFSIGTHLLPSGNPELFWRELSKAGGTNGSATAAAKQEVVTARAARLSGRGR